MALFKKMHEMNFEKANVADSWYLINYFEYHGKIASFAAATESQFKLQ